MAARRCAGAGDSACPFLLATWDKHKLCLSHRTCTRNSTCTLCESWGDKEWNYIPLRVKKTGKKKRTTRSLVSPQDSTPPSPSVTFGHSGKDSGLSEKPVSASVDMGILQGSVGDLLQVPTSSCSSLPPRGGEERNAQVSLTGGESNLVTAGDFSSERASQAYNSQGRAIETLGESLDMSDRGQSTESNTRPAGLVSQAQGVVPAPAGITLLADAEVHTSASDSWGHGNVPLGRDSDRARGDIAGPGIFQDSASRTVDRDSTQVDSDAQSQPLIDHGPCHDQWGYAQWGPPPQRFPWQGGMGPVQACPIPPTTQGQTGNARFAPGGDSSSQRMNNPWAMYPPFPWGGYGPHMGWYPQGYGTSVPGYQSTHPNQRDYSRASMGNPRANWSWPAPPPGIPFPQLPVESHQQVGEMEGPRFVVPKVPLQARETSGARTRSLSGSPTRFAEGRLATDPHSGRSSPTGMDYTSGDEGLPSSEPQILSSFEAPWEAEEEPAGSDSDSQKPELPSGSSTYEEALSQVRPFLASLKDPQGYPIAMDPPTAPSQRRMTSLLAGPTETSVKGGLPWVLDLGNAHLRLNLSLRGVPKSQQRRYLTEGLPLPSPDQSTMGRGAYPGSFSKGADMSVFHSYPYRLPELGDTVDLPPHVPEIPQRLWAAHPNPPSQVNLSWKAACDGEQLIRQQASLLSHACWWNFALQRKLQSLSDNLFDMDPAEVGRATTEAASWAQAGLTVSTKALEQNQTLMAQFLLLRRDAVLQQTGLPKGRSSLLRAAPLESPFLFGPRFDELASIWTVEDEQAKTLGGGKKPSTSYRPAPQGGGKAFGRPKLAPKAKPADSKPKARWWRNRQNKPGPKTSKGGNKPPSGK